MCESITYSRICPTPQGGIPNHNQCIDPDRLRRLKAVNAFYIIRDVCFLVFFLIYKFFTKCGKKRLKNRKFLPHFVNKHKN
jgi:hypothetical protein